MSKHRIVPNKYIPFLLVNCTLTKFKTIRKKTERRHKKRKVRKKSLRGKKQ